MSAPGRPLRVPAMPLDPPGDLRGLACEAGPMSFLCRPRFADPAAFGAHGSSCCGMSAAVLSGIDPAAPGVLRPCP